MEPKPEIENLLGLKGIHSPFNACMYRDTCKETEEYSKLYKWLRSQHWNDNTICAVVKPKDAMKLGHDAPSGDRLDQLIREAMKNEGV